MFRHTTRHEAPPDQFEGRVAAISFVNILAFESRAPMFLKQNEGTMGRKATQFTLQLRPVMVIAYQKLYFFALRKSTETNTNAATSRCGHTLANV